MDSTEDLRKLEEQVKHQPFHQVYKSQPTTATIFPNGNLIDDLIEKLNSSNSEAKFMIHDLVLLNPFFAQNLISPSSDPHQWIFPVGIVDDIIVQELQTSTKILLLSSYTLTKGLIKHKEVELEDFMELQDLIDNGGALREGRPQYPRHVVLWKVKNGKYLVAVIKATQNGKELYLQTLYYSDIKDLNKTRKGKILRGSLAVTL